MNHLFVQKTLQKFWNEFLSSIVKIILNNNHLFQRIKELL